MLIAFDGARRVLCVGDMEWIVADEKTGPWQAGTFALIDASY